MKLIHEVRDWETELTVKELANNGLEVKVSNGTPKGYFKANLSYDEGFELMQALHTHYRGRPS